MKEKDIFDRLFAAKPFRIFQPFYLKYKEQLLYLFFGGLTTVISISVFLFFTAVIPCDELIANLISWIVAVLFAFLTNRTWVFESNSQESFFKQMQAFYLGRVATLGVEELILLLFVKVLSMNAMIVKVIAQVVVVVLNYVISKLYIFKKQ